MSIDIVSEIRLILEEHKHFSLHDRENINYLAGMIAEALDEEQVDDRQIDMFTGTSKKISDWKPEPLEYSEFAHLTTDHKDEVKYDGDGKKLVSSKLNRRVKSYGIFKNEYYDD